MASSLVSLISKKIIKPSILTPPTKKSHKLSFIDQVMHMSIPMAFFYPKIGNYEPTHVSQILEKSLSKLLSFYYPYAGRLNKDDANYVDCNDMGVELSHVHIHCPMSQFFRQPYTNDEHVVFPVEQPYAHMHEGNLATIQVSYFDCKGIAIGGCLSHKIGDGFTTSNFFKNWGILTRDINATLSLHFVRDSIFPQSIDPSVVSTIKSKESTYLGKRFMFPVDKLNALKAKIAHESEIQNPTRVEVVSELLYKCALVTKRVYNSGSFEPSSFFQVANMRQRLNPPLSHDTCGNIFFGYLVEINNEKDVNCPKLVGEMRKGKLNLHAKESAIISEVVKLIDKGKTPFQSNEVDSYLCSSLLKFPLYKVDFGWGRPIRVSMGTGPSNKFFILLDNQSGGGVEAIVMLDEQHMAIFERDPELLEFASPITNL
ncbi:acyltransferase Pun1-like [Solanum verrucosum]|uniref:acyltransferase Pun1-like n=1 Tax=Solanum verrucosum TaxID=315347 RepID=UPI0020D0EE4E|nr:acyltransferase Pun1-like [Solanum verrucosum]